MARVSVKKWLKLDLKDKNVKKDTLVEIIVDNENSFLGEDRKKLKVIMKEIINKISKDLKILMITEERLRIQNKFTSIPLFSLTLLSKFIKLTSLTLYNYFPTRMDAMNLIKTFKHLKKIKVLSLQGYYLSRRGIRFNEEIVVLLTIGLSYIKNLNITMLKEKGRDIFKSLVKKEKNILLRKSFTLLFMREKNKYYLENFQNRFRNENYASEEDL